MSENLILEIGTEEIPAKLMGEALLQLKLNAEKYLNENRVFYKEINVYGTPRRLVLYVKDMEEKQLDNEQLVKGPTKKVAYTEDGTKSKALEGFLKSNAIDEKAVFIDTFNNNEYVFAKRFEEGKSTLEILSQLLPQIIYSLSFSKSMRWGDHKLKFIRPIRWILSLLGSNVVEFEIEGIKASNLSSGHRTLSNHKIKISNPTDYFEKMKLSYVIIDSKEREKIIISQIQNLAETQNAYVAIDKELLEEVIYLVEFPTAFIGGFEEEFLVLPTEAIIIPMKEHQRYFPLFKDNKLLPYFIGIRNGDDTGIEIVRAGNERVLRARLKDAQFFFNEDLKESLESKVEKLKKIVYQSKLGTIFDKVERFSKIGIFLGQEMGISDMQIELFKRAAILSKADLVTSMVNEFDELQGIMGRELALRNNEEKKVVEAISSHYLPRFAGDEVPRDLIGIILSLSDRIDTIVGNFVIGIVPSGSQDPYGLRRHSLAIINIVVENKLDFDLSALVEFSANLLNAKITIEDKFILVKIENFFKQRIRGMLLDMGVEMEIVDSVLEQKLTSINDIFVKVKEIAQYIQEDPAFSETITALSRVFNISNKVLTENVDPSLFQNEYEKNLYEMSLKVGEEIKRAIELKNFKEGLGALKQLESSINDFFENVLVMDDDEIIRKNRLSLMLNVATSVNSICNVDKLMNLYTKFCGTSKELVK